MNLCLSGVLDAESLKRIRARLDTANFADGASTAGWNARSVKRNEQALDAEAADLITHALDAHPLFAAAALPARRTRPLFSRYRAGMAYGLHVDDALMGADRLRTDLALTIFLCEPERYDGGELVIESASGSQAYKLGAGQAVLYPATALHRVNEVTRGERLAAVLWVQSLVRDASRREVLFDLECVRRELWTQAGEQATESFNLLSKTTANLMRAWAEP